MLNAVQWNGLIGLWIKHLIQRSVNILQRCKISLILIFFSTSIGLYGLIPELQLCALVRVRWSVSSITRMFRNGCALA